MKKNKSCFTTSRINFIHLETAVKCMYSRNVGRGTYFQLACLQVVHFLQFLFPFACALTPALNYPVLINESTSTNRFISSAAMSGSVMKHQGLFLLYSHERNAFGDCGNPKKAWRERYYTNKYSRPALGSN